MATFPIGETPTNSLHAPPFPRRTLSVRAVRIWMFCVALSATATAQHVEACKTPPTMLQLIESPLVTSAIHKRVHVSVEPDGASALSQEWVEGKRKVWFIENQREGADLIEAGVVLKDHAMVAQGLQMFEWGFKHQSKDTGGFPESSDPFHSVSIFLVDLERSMLVIEESQPEFKDMEPRVQAMLPQMAAAAHWLLHPEVLETGRASDDPYTHRRWILAAVLGDAGQLTGDKTLTEAAVMFAKDGLALQHEDGTNPERGGFDVSYQMVDAVQGARYYTSLNCKHDAALMAEVRQQLIKTCQWEMKHLLPDGSVDPTGSTRILKEKLRSGELKQANYKEIVQAFTYTSIITHDPQYLQVATKMAASQGW